MQIQKDAQEPSAASTIHATAKPLSRAIAWSTVAAGAATLAAAAVRTLRES